MRPKIIPENIDYYGFSQPSAVKNGDSWANDVYPYALWFEYLVLSPSYELARRHRAGDALDTEALPEDFDVVLAVYDDLGDVRFTLFREWWRRVGMPFFDTPGVKPRVWYFGTAVPGVGLNAALQENFELFFEEDWLDCGEMPTLFLAAPGGLPFETICSDIKAIWSRTSAEEKTLLKTGRYGLLTENFRAPAYRSYHFMVQCKALCRPDVTLPLWKVGDIDFFDEVYGPEEDPIRPVGKKPDYTDQKTRASNNKRALERARMIAENAARGHFPSHERCKNALEFNFEELGARLKRRWEWQKGEIARRENMRSKD